MSAMRRVFVEALLLGTNCFWRIFIIFISFNAWRSFGPSFCKMGSCLESEDVTSFFVEHSKWWIAWISINFRRMILWDRFRVEKTQGLGWTDWNQQQKVSETQRTLHLPTLFYPRWWLQPIWKPTFKISSKLHHLPLKICWPKNTNKNIRLPKKQQIGSFPPVYPVVWWWILWDPNLWPELRPLGVTPTRLVKFGHGDFISFEKGNCGEVHLQSIKILQQNMYVVNIFPPKEIQKLGPKTHRENARNKNISKKIRWKSDQTPLLTGISNSTPTPNWYM